MERNNEELKWPRVLCLELKDGMAVDRKVLHYDYDTDFNYVEERVDKCMRNGYIPDNDLFVVLYPPSTFTPASLAPEDLPQHARKYETELEDNCGWEILVDGPLRLVAFCRSEGYNPTPANMTALAESSRYKDFCSKYERDPEMAIQENLSFPEAGKKQIGDRFSKDGFREKEAQQESGNKMALYYTDNTGNMEQNIKNIPNRMENKQGLKSGSDGAGQPSEQERNDYDASWLMKILENGFPKGGIKDTPPFIFSHHAQFEEIGRNLVDPSRDGGLTQALARDIAVVLLAKRFPGLAAVAAPVVDTALKSIEVKPAVQAGVQEPQTEKRKEEMKRKPARQENPGSKVRKKGRGL